MKIKKSFAILLLTLLSQNIFTKTTQHESFRDSLAHAITISKTEPDVAIELLDEWCSAGIEMNDSNKVIRCLLISSQIQEARLHYANALDLSSQALFLSEAYGDTLLMAKTYSHYASLFLHFNKTDAAGSYLEKACQFHKHGFKQGDLSNRELISAYFKLNRYLQRISDYETALSYLDSCYLIADSINYSTIERAYLDGEKGQIRLLNGDINEAIQILIASSLVFEDLDETEEDRSYLVILYSNLGDAYQQLKEQDLALFFYEKAIKVSRTTTNFLDKKPSILENYAAVLFDQGWYVEAYENLREAKTLNDLYFSPSNLLTSNFFNLNEHYRQDLIQKNKTLSDTTQELAKRKHQNILLKIALFLLIILILVLVSYARYRSRQKQQKHALVVKKQEKEDQQTATKNQELLRTTVEQLEGNALLTQLGTALKNDIKPEERESLLNQIKQHTQHTWEEFNTQFNEINQGFYERLSHKIPQLSPADQKICALIKLNFSGKEMSQLLGISIGSVHMASHRLRKKLNMQRDESLSDMISTV